MDAQRLNEVTRWGKVPAWWLLHPEMDADRFSVMAALATYMDDGGFCEPSQATLARRLKRSRPWVNRVVAQLASVGLLSKTTRSRPNGGTTSCRYRLALSPTDVAAEDPTGGVSAVTRERPPGDSPRHPRDRNQPVPEQIQEARPAARGRAEPPDEAGGTAAEPSSHPPAPPRQIEVPCDWSPSEEAIAEARRLCPEADLDEHTAIFVSRCRARGYRFARDGVGHAWLAWLLEDRRKARERARPRQSSSAVESPHGGYLPAGPAGHAHRYDRFDAWAAAATRRSPAA